MSHYNLTLDQTWSLTENQVIFLLQGLQTITAWNMANTIPAMIDEKGWKKVQNQRPQLLITSKLEKLIERETKDKGLRGLDG